MIKMQRQRGWLLKTWARVHDSGHLGINRSLDMVASKYYWPGLSKDVKLYVLCLCDSIILYCRQGVVVMWFLSVYFGFCWC